MKLRMMRGLPGSGKSTVTKQFVKDSGSAGRVNRDDLRSMLFDGVWSGQREKVVVEIEKAIAQVLIKNKMTPTIDDTNLQRSHEDMWKNFCKDNNVTFEMNDMNTDITTCIERDSKREKPVGEVIIKRMALDAGMIDFGEKKLVIVDIDGSISSCEHREHYVSITGDRKVKDWYGYFTEMVNDVPIQHIIDWVNELSKDYTICIVSGRPDTYQLETLYWLHHVAKIHFDHLFMRRGSDRRPDVNVKSDILAKLPKSQILMVLDDRPSVCRMWKAADLFCIPVRGAIEEF
jgi:predicted kinase